MGYDQYSDRVISSWDFSSQMALWRERAIHQSRRAEFFKHLAEANAAGATVNPSDEEPQL